MDSTYTMHRAGLNLTKKAPMKETKPEMRSFESGATRNTDDGKLDYEGFLSPLALKRYAEYLNQHRRQADGELRDSDNWQKGVPLDVYMKSKFRHFMDVWMLHRGGTVIEDGEHVTIQDALCAELFNAMGYLHELIKAEEADCVEPPLRPSERRSKCSPECKDHPDHATRPDDGPRNFRRGIPREAPLGIEYWLKDSPPANLKPRNPMYGKYCLRIAGKCEHKHYKGCLSCESTPILRENTP